MNFVDLKLFKSGDWWWEHESIDSSIFTKMDWRLFSFKASNDSITLYETLMTKVLKSNCRKLWSLCKKSTSSLTSFLKYSKDIENLLFWQFWECLSISIRVLVSICSKPLYLSACKKSSPSLTSLFRYCKKIADWLFWLLWACLVTHTQNYSINM